MISQIDLKHFSAHRHPVTFADPCPGHLPNTHPKEFHMKSVLISALVATGLVAAAPAFANKDLATKSGCMACHAVDKKLVGPSYQDVAKKYKASDEATLVAKVKTGGKGVWGQIPMPPNAKLTDDEAKTLVKWVLGGAK
jgi:cytochrome c